MWGSFHLQCDVEIFVLMASDISNQETIGNKVPGLLSEREQILTLFLSLLPTKEVIWSYMAVVGGG